MWEWLGVFVWGKENPNNQTSGGNLQGVWKRNKQFNWIKDVKVWQCWSHEYRIHTKKNIKKQKNTLTLIQDMQLLQRWSVLMPGIGKTNNQTNKQTKMQYLTWSSLWESGSVWVCLCQEEGDTSTNVSAQGTNSQHTPQTVRNTTTTSQKTVKEKMNTTFDNNTKNIKNVRNIWISGLHPSPAVKQTWRVAFLTFFNKPNVAGVAQLSNL